MSFNSDPLATFGKDSPKAHAKRRVVGRTRILTHATFFSVVRAKGGGSFHSFFVCKETHYRPKLTAGALLDFRLR